MVPAWAADVVVRTGIDPASGVVVGQPIRLHVDVLFAGSMPRPPRVRLGDAPGAQTLRFETQGVTMRDEIGGHAYVGQQFEFVIFPRRGGAIEIPAAEITLIDAAGDVFGAARGEPQRIAVAVPPGIDASGPVIAAKQVTVSQTWEPDPGRTHLKAGDALIRTVRRQAADVPAMGMPDLAFPAPNGVRLYRDAPRSADRINRGSVTGERIDRVTYVFEKPGAYDLPSIVQPWWDLGDRQARTETLPGVRVSVAAAAAPAGPRPVAGTRWSWTAITMLCAALLLGVPAWLLRKRVAARWSRWRADQAASEAAARSALRRAARTGDAGATYEALTVWLRRLPPGDCRRIREDRRLARPIEQLERALFGVDGDWSVERGRTLRDAVSEVHRDLRQPPVRVPPADLPPLNPPLPTCGAGPSGR